MDAAPVTGGLEPETLEKVPLRLEPTPCIAVIAATAMSVAMRLYAVRRLLYLRRCGSLGFLQPG